MKMHLSLHTNSYGMSDQSTKVKKSTKFKNTKYNYENLFLKKYILLLLIAFGNNNRLEQLIIQFKLILRK